MCQSPSVHIVRLSNTIATNGHQKRANINVLLVRGYFGTSGKSITTREPPQRSRAMSNKVYCSGIVLTGRWRGRTCWAIGKYEGPDDKMYCPAHIDVAERCLDKFKAAQEAFQKRIGAPR